MFRKFWDWLFGWIQKEDVQQLIMKIVMAIIKEKYGGKIQSKDSIGVFQNSLSRLGKQVGWGKARQYKLEVAKEVDKYTNHRVAENYVKQTRRQRIS